MFFGRETIFWRIVNILDLFEDLKKKSQKKVFRKDNVLKVDERFQEN